MLPVGGYHVNGYLAACLRVVATNPNDGPIGHYGGQEREERCLAAASIATAGRAPDCFRSSKKRAPADAPSTPSQPGSGSAECAADAIEDAGHRR